MRRLLRVLSRVGLSGVVSGLVATALFVLSFVDVFGAWRACHGEAVRLLLLGLMLFLLLVATLSYAMVRFWMRCQRGELGFRLQARVVLAFTVVGIVPVLLVSAFSSMFFDYGVRAWFYGSVHPAFLQCIALGDQSGSFSEVLRADVVRLTKYILGDLGLSQERMCRGADLLGFTRVSLIRGTEVITCNESDSAFWGAVPLGKLPSDGEVVTFVKEGIIHAITLLSSSDASYVVVARSLTDADDKSSVLRNRNIRDYQADLKLQMSALQLQFSLAFLLLFLVLLFVSIWLGVGFSKSIVDPLVSLFRATKRVQSGEFDFRIEDREPVIEEEIITVIRAFNGMIERLSIQRTQLEKAYREINSRKEFMETVLSGVSSGVMALSPHAEVTLMNNRARELLCCETLHKTVEEVFPEVLKLINMTQHTGEITIIREQRALTLAVHIVQLREGAHIITFDDISGLVEAQRKAAWSDVARRIAHEIKNPITPIFLAAERLSSKYAGQIVSEKATFLKYTDTIMRHATNLSNMVDEFAKFARMPRPVFAVCDICSLLGEVSFAGQFGKKVVHYDLNFPQEKVLVLLDREQIVQVFVNIFKNACEAMENKEDSVRISVTVSRSKRGVTVEVQDNGDGFPVDLIGKLTEPYVTMRSQGTGLGLAIVKKILDEHGASINFYNSEKGGVVLITFSLNGQESAGFLNS